MCFAQSFPSNLVLFKVDLLPSSYYIISNFIYEAISHGCQVDTVYLDFWKAFNMVQHSQLLIKLWNVGIRGSLWKWFESYLIGRRHCVRIFHSLSDTLPVLFV